MTNKTPQSDRPFRVGPDYNRQYEDEINATKKRIQDAKDTETDDDQSKKRCHQIR